jgi:hypothetical protein
MVAILGVQTDPVGMARFNGNKVKEPIGIYAIEIKGL